MKTSYDSELYHIFKATIYILIIYICMILILFPISLYFKKVLILVFGYILISTIPFLFKKRVLSIFTNRVKILFDAEDFSIIEYNHKEELIKETHIQWNEIESYKFNFLSIKSTEFTLYLKNGSKKHFIFKENKNQEQAINEKSFFSIFYYYIKQYNKENNNDVINLKPGFFTTKLGSIVIFSIFCLSVFGIIIHFFINPKTFKFSFMSFFIVLGLIAKRKADINFYNLINQLEPRLPID